MRNSLWTTINQYLVQTHSRGEFYLERNAYDAKIRKFQQWAKQYKHLSRPVLLKKVVLQVSPFDESP